MTYFICNKCGSEVIFDAWEKRWRCSSDNCENNLGEVTTRKIAPDWVQKETG